MKGSMFKTSKIVSIGKFRALKYHSLSSLYIYGFKLFAAAWLNLQFHKQENENDKIDSVF
jgi:hypothetical protein